MARAPYEAVHFYQNRSCFFEFNTTVSERVNKHVDNNKTKFDNCKIMEEYLEKESFYSSLISSKGTITLI